MRLYSIQPVAFWEMCKASGVMTPDPAKIQQDFLPAYGWMREQMGRRLPSFSGDYPIWAWVQAPAWVQLESGDVLLALEVPEERVMLSDFGTWDVMLTGCLDEPESAPIPSIGALVGAEAECMWTRMFDADVLSRAKPTETQACIDRVYPHEAVEVRPIRGRQRGEA